MGHIAQLAAVANEWVEILHRDRLGLNPKRLPAANLHFTGSSRLLLYAIKPYFIFVHI